MKLINLAHCPKKPLLLLLLALILAATPAPAEEEEIVFSKSGTIERIDSQGVVIDDCSYLFSPASHFLGKNGEVVSSSSFKAKDFIAFQATTKGKIIAIGLASRKDTLPTKSKGIEITPPEQTPAPSQIPSGIIFENGKWHN